MYGQRPREPTRGHFTECHFKFAELVTYYLLSGLGIAIGALAVANYNYVLFSFFF